MAAIPQRGQHEKHQNGECDDDACQRTQPAPAGHDDDHDGEDAGQDRQWQAAFVVVEAVAGDALLVDLPENSDLFAGRQVRLTGSAGELQQRAGAGIGPGVDRHDGLDAGSAARDATDRCRGEHLSGRGTAAVAQPAGLHASAFGGHRATRGVLERQRNVGLGP
jgi:hypothetical protein